MSFACKPLGACIMCSAARHMGAWGRREAMAQQVPGFRQRWFGRMHRIDKFFHHVPPPPGAALQTPHSAPISLVSPCLRDAKGLIEIHEPCTGLLSAGFSGAFQHP